MAQKQNQGVLFQVNASLVAVLTLEDISSHEPIIKSPLFGTHPSSYCPREDMPGIDEFLNLLLLETMGWWGQPQPKPHAFRMELFP